MVLPSRNARSVRQRWKLSVGERKRRRTKALHRAHYALWSVFSISSTGRGNRTPGLLDPQSSPPCTSMLRPPLPARTSISTQEQLPDGRPSVRRGPGDLVAPDLCRTGSTAPASPSELVHEHRYLALPRRRDRLLRRHPEPPFLHLLQEIGRGYPPGVGDQGRGARPEQLWDQARKQGDVPALVEHVRGEHEVEGTLKVPKPGGTPVEEPRLEVTAEVRPRVVRRKVEGGLVVVRRKRPGAPFERDDAREPYPAAELDRRLARKVLEVETPGKSRGAGPELRPVRKPFVTGELLLVEEGVGRDRVGDGVGLLPDLDARLRDTGPPGEVRLQGLQSAPPAFQGFLAEGGGEGGLRLGGFRVVGPCAGRRAARPLLGGNLGDGVAAEDALEGLSRLVPDFARHAERRVGDVARAAARAARRANLAVEDLDDVEDRDLLGGRGEAEPAARAAAALQDLCAAEVAEDLLQKPLGDALPARKLRNP